jgi:hypothetical protein
MFVRIHFSLAVLVVGFLSVLGVFAQIPAPPTSGKTAPLLPPTEKGEYLGTVQQATFRYFWDFAHPVSGLAPERTATPNIVTSGGTGFGVSAIVVGAYRQWITREQAVARLLKMVKFLEKADRFHGAWSHWLDGRTGKVVPFSRYDDGGDLVETAYLVNGLLVARAFFDGKNAAEAELRQRITALWHSVEWDWYVRNGKLHWHWSPRHGWKMNMPIAGYNECLITYVLAMGSPTHPITFPVYEASWKGHEPSHFINGKEFLGYKLPLGFDWGGPLFFEHYSYLSLDPRLMQDEHTNYWQLVMAHTLINRAYCLEKAPKEFGYSEENWGLTASDNHLFYGAHQPTEDNGTISPTAALSSFPYTPYYSMQVLMNLYRRKGNPLFGDYGFYDTYNQQKGWYSNQYLAIDQGPIVVMIENYRTGLVWRLGEKIPELWAGLQKMNIRRPDYPTGFYMYVPERNSNAVDLMRHADDNRYHLDFYVATAEPVRVELTDAEGKTTVTLADNRTFAKGPQRLFFEAEPGRYTAAITQGGKTEKIAVVLR